MTPSAAPLQPVADRVVSRARQQGHVSAAEVRAELARAGLPETLDKDVLALARASLSYRDGSYHYVAFVSDRVAAERGAIEEAVARLTRQHEARGNVERRERGRIDFLHPVTVTAEDGRAFTLLSRDLSSSGMRLVGTRRLSGQKVRVRVELGGEAVEFVLRVLWTCPVGDDLVENGGSFIGVST